MRYRNIIIGLGFLTMVIQFTGFPDSWRNVFQILAGLAVVVFAYVAGKERKAAQSVSGESINNNL